MSALARLALLLVVVLVSLSAYLRLAHSGIGCAEWPECYARIGAPAVASATPTDAVYERLATEGRQPLGWATPLHRLVASVLGIVTILLLVAACGGAANGCWRCSRSAWCCSSPCSGCARAACIRPAW